MRMDETSRWDSMFSGFEGHTVSDGRRGAGKEEMQTVVSKLQSE